MAFNEDTRVKIPAILLNQLSLYKIHLKQEIIRIKADKIILHQVIKLQLMVKNELA
jgi:hypothetical protein